MRLPHWPVLTATVAASLMLGVCSTASAASAPPRHNIPPSNNFIDTCASKGANNRTCIAQAVRAIEHARTFEPMKKRALILPANYRRLSIAEQTFVVTDLERVDRGLRPYAGLTANLDSVAHSAAVTRSDPSLATYQMRKRHVDEYGGIWAGDFGPLASDYDWMYNDGYSRGGSLNIECAGPSSPGCWGHRCNILYPDTGYSSLSAGAGTGKPAGGSIAEILVGGNGSRPAYVYTWREALRHGANGHRLAVR